LRTGDDLNVVVDQRRTFDTAASNVDVGLDVTSGGLGSGPGR
jgi:hypothetical protein